MPRIIIVRKAKSLNGVHSGGVVPHQPGVEHHPGVQHHSDVKLKPDTHLEFFGRITKVQKRGQNTIFEVLTPKTGYILKCSSQYFSPVMEGDAIFAKGFVDETGEIVNISQPPFISPGNDEDSVLQSCHVAIGNREKVRLIMSEIRKLLQPDEDLATRLDYLSISHQKVGKDLLKYMVTDTLQGDADKLLTWWYRKRCLRRLYLLGLTNKEIDSTRYDPVELFGICLNNPYRISSLSIEKCESILHRINKTLVPEDKYCGEIARTIKKYLDQKWTYVPKSVMIKDYSAFKNYEAKLQSEYDVCITPDSVALKSTLDIEQDVANTIKELLDREAPSEDIDDLASFLDDHKCDEDQRQAIRGILENNVTIVTGSAGTGKTTLLRALTSYLEKKGLNFILSSFTGKAVARIKEVVHNSNPLTLHKLIYAKTDMMENVKYIIIDEVSMLDTELFYLFTKHYPISKYEYKVVFVGDINQLPPIGWGCFFQEIIKSGMIPTFQLRINHRTEGVGIVTNAQLLLEETFFEQTPDFQLCYDQTPLDIIRKYGLTIDNVRVLAPFVETVDDQNRRLQAFFTSGLPNLEDNKGRKWFLRDRVMMTKNNYAINVMNGQEGFVSYFDPEEKGINVAFNDGEVHFFAFQSDNIKKVMSYYPAGAGKYLDLDTCEELIPIVAKKKKYCNDKYRICGDDKILFHNIQHGLDSFANNDVDSIMYPPVDHLMHSYALTVHKAQGSEWDYIIVYLPKRDKTSDFITSNLLYTAITRARKGVYCLGDKVSWLRGILNTERGSLQLLCDFILQ